MDLNINIKLSIDSKVYGLLSRLVGKSQVIEVTGEELLAEADAPEEPKAAAPEEPKAAAPEEPKADAPEEPKAAAPEEPKADAPEEPKADPMLEVRQKLEATRRRILGDDYRDNPTGELPKRYTRALTTQIRSLLMSYGAQTPKELKDESIAKFCADLDNIVVGEDGELTTQAAF